MDASTLRRLLAAAGQKRPVVLATRLRDGRQALLFDDTDASVEDGWPHSAARRALAEDRTLLAAQGDDQILLRPYNPPVRLFVIGAVHVAQPLVSIAAQAGLDVLVIDPRDAFATPDRFPDVPIARGWPDRILRDAALDHRSAVVALTHDAKIDEPALAAALDTPAFYIGALGSRTTHEKRLRNLRERGVPDDALGRIHAPIGLDIGARSPGEIAVAIVAQLIQHLRQSDGSAMERTEHPRIAAIVLAAGASARMDGLNKLVEEIDGLPLVRRVVASLEELPFADRVVVTGFDADRVRAALDGTDVRFVHNVDHAQGIASSVRAGVASLESDVEGALIVPGDMPWLSPADIQPLLDAFGASAEPPICIPVRHGRRGNPVLWPARHFSALRDLAGDTGGRQLFARLAHELREVEVGGDGVVRDVDTRESLREARARKPERRSGGAAG